MRTIDPELWYRKVKKPRIQVARIMKYGLKPATGIESLIRASFFDAMKEFRSNCSIGAIVRVGTIVDYYQKNFYILMLATTLCIGLCVVGYNVYVLGNKPPLLITLQSSHRSVQYIPFPAVALCSNNVFSDKALDKYTAYLYSKDNNSTYTKEEIKSNLLSFGALLNLVLLPVDVMFMKFLTHVQPRFNLTDLMFNLSPKCTSILRRCSWRGRLRPCDRLFASRITPLGFCCAFNSRYQPEDITTAPKILDLVGQDFGLSFVVQSNEDDFVYARRPSDGYEILMFEGSEYPLIEGGGVRVYPVQRNTSMFLAVSAHAEIPSHTLSYYSETWRGCRLRDSSSSKSWRSSYAWCLAYCRSLSVAALCACRPHTLPHDARAEPLCTPDHLACLNKHREKFMYYYPGEQSGPSLDEELQDAQECLHCAPDCARLAYSAAVTYKHYQYRDNIFQNFVSKGLSLVNATLLRIFYLSKNQQLYAVETNLRWYEAIALLASQWVSVMGVTIVTISELVFYCTIRWAHHFTRRARVVRRMNTMNKS